MSRESYCLVLSILKCTGFFRFGEGERRRLLKGDNFLQQLRRSGVSRVCREKVAAARTEKLCTCTHTHTGRLLYPRYSPAAARVMTTKVHSSHRPHSSAARPIMSSVRLRPLNVLHCTTQANKHQVQTDATCQYRGICSNYEQWISLF